MIDPVSQNSMLAAMSAGATQPNTQAHSAAVNKVDSDHDGDAGNGTAAVNDGDADDLSSPQPLQAGSSINIRV